MAHNRTDVDGHFRYWKFRAFPTLIAAPLFVAVFAVTALAQDVQAPQANVKSAVTNSSNSTADASMTLTDSPNNATNTANDPATPHRQILLQNYFVPSSDGYDGRSADQQLLKLFLPVKLFGVQNSFRIYQPIATSPLFPDGRNAGFGDTTVYDLALHEVSRFTVGAGPLLVLPVASHKDIGAGKWQAGVAGVVSTKSSFGLIAAVITYQHSFSGYGSDRPEVNLVTVQPLVFYNLKKHYYLRSSGFWNLNYGDHVSQIPVGFGAGKVWSPGKRHCDNFYLEPQYSVYHTGTGAPIWQIVSGLVFTFPTRH